MAAVLSELDDVVLLKNRGENTAKGFSLLPTGFPKRLVEHGGASQLATGPQ